MTQHSTIRFLIHPSKDGTSISWTCAHVITGVNGHPRARWMEHGRVDVHDTDPSGLDSLALLVFRAASQHA